MIKKLIMINDALLEKNKNNISKYKKYSLIKEILNKDKPFFNMEIEYAYAILRDLTIPEDKLKIVYEALIDIK